jgi:hypothetical protein
MTPEIGHDDPCWCGSGQEYRPQSWLRYVCPRVAPAARMSTFVCPGPNLRSDGTTRDFDQKLSILGHDSGSANFSPWPFASATGLDPAISGKKGNARVIGTDLACDARAGVALWKVNRYHVTAFHPGNSSCILGLAEAGEIRLAVSDDILNEVGRVLLRPKFGWSQDFPVPPQTNRSQSWLRSVCPRVSCPITTCLRIRVRPGSMKRSGQLAIASSIRRSSIRSR